MTREADVLRLTDVVGGGAPHTKNGLRPVDFSRRGRRRKEEKLISCFSFVYMGSRRTAGGSGAEAFSDLPLLARRIGHKLAFARSVPQQQHARKGTRSCSLFHVPYTSAKERYSSLPSLRKRARYVTFCGRALSNRVTHSLSHSLLLGAHGLFFPCFAVILFTFQENSMFLNFDGSLSRSSPHL